ncbi:MAG: DUF2288 domain-containing protein [Thiolinea sp.]
MHETSLPLHTRLNLETAPISWAELERFFARGRVLQVASQLDLVEVATALAQDDTARFKQWLESEAVRHLPDEVARQWAEDDRHLWAVVVAPWVIAQDRR